MDCDTYYSSQASTQGCHATQEVGSQQLDQSVCDEDVWGRLLSLRRNVQVYNLIKDNYLFGRGEATYRFTEEFFDTKFLSTLSKLHFRIYREKNSSEEFVVILEDTSFNGTFVNKILIGKNNKKVLRNNDEISLATPLNKVFVYYDCHNNDACEYPPSLTTKYTMTKKLGSGTYGEVRLAYADGSLDRVAVKIVSKKILSANGTTVRFSNVSQIDNEIKLLRSVNHPCIVRLLDLIDSEDRIYIVMELAGGGELFDRISNFGKLKEPIAKIYFYQLVHAVCYLHDKKIVHRDIKPENILLDCDDEYARIKLTDFGLSKLTNDASKMTSLVGTPTYIAPEFLIDEEGRFYNSKVDMWSLGVVLFVCLAGYAPFNGATDVETRINIKQAKFNMRKPCWSKVSSEAKDLVKKLLVLDPKNRLSAEQVLQHPWLDDTVMMKRAYGLMKLPLQMSPPKRALDEDTIDGVKPSKKKLNGIGSSEAEGSEYPKIMSGLDFESTDDK